MKKTVVLIFVLVSVFLLTVSCSSLGIKGGDSWEASDFISTPESVYFDPDSELLYVSNIAGEGTKKRREEYANDLDDPEHLIAVKSYLVRRKGDQGPDKWLPPNDEYHCQYVEDWQAIKQRWGLTLSAAELKAISTVKETCPEAIAK